MQTLTVKQLIAFLKTQNQNALVALSADGEGNSFSLVADNNFFADKVFLKYEFGCQCTFFDEEEMARQNDGIVKDYFGTETKTIDLKECLILFGTN